MGFKKPKRTYVLEFQDETDYEDLVVKVRPPTVGEALRNMDLSWMYEDELTEEQRVAKLMELYELFLTRLVSWNIEDEDDQPVPTTLEGLQSLDQDFGLRIVRSWLFETSAVSRPLESGSPGGDPSVEASIPMEPPSQSLAS
jgi:hypothetical protein